MTVSNSKDTNQASELYELCKKVYELTEWNNQELLGGWIQDQFDGPENRGTFTTRDQIETILFKLICPLYTSDYLLEKLPYQDDDGVYALFGVCQLLGEKGRAILAYWERDSGAYYAEESDTPLKALLKLTIALSEAGELDNDQSR